MKIRASGKEFSLPKMTSDQLNQIFGAGKWEIIESKSLSSLTSDDKAKRLGLDPGSEVWKDLKTLIEKAQESTKEVQSFLSANKIEVACGFYIGNPRNQS